MTLTIESQKSAEKIAMMIQTLQKQSLNATGAMSRSFDEVNAGNTAVTSTLDVFSQIVAHIQEISENTSSVAAAAELQAAAVQEITASVHELENHVTKTSEEAVSSAAATEETSAALDQISHSVSQVANTPDHINREMVSSRCKKIPLIIRQMPWFHFFSIFQPDVRWIWVR